MEKNNRIFEFNGAKTIKGVLGEIFNIISASEDKTQVVMSNFVVMDRNYAITRGYGITRTTCKKFSKYIYGVSSLKKIREIIIKDVPYGSRIFLTVRIGKPNGEKKESIISCKWMGPTWYDSLEHGHTVTYPVRDVFEFIGGFSWDKYIPIFDKISNMVILSRKVNQLFKENSSAVPFLKHIKSVLNKTIKDQEQMVNAIMSSKHKLEDIKYEDRVIVTEWLAAIDEVRKMISSMRPDEINMLRRIAAIRRKSKKGKEKGKKYPKVEPFQISFHGEGAQSYITNLRFFVKP